MSEMNCLAWFHFAASHTRAAEEKVLAISDAQFDFLCGRRSILDRDMRFDRFAKSARCWNLCAAMLSQICTCARARVVAAVCYPRAL